MASIWFSYCESTNWSLQLVLCKWYNFFPSFLMSFCPYGISQMYLSIMWNGMNQTRNEHHWPLAWIGINIILFLHGWCGMKLLASIGKFSISIQSFHLTQKIGMTMRFFQVSCHIGARNWQMFEHSMQLCFKINRQSSSLKSQFVRHAWFGDCPMALGSIQGKWDLDILGPVIIHVHWQFYLIACICFVILDQIRRCFMHLILETSLTLGSSIHNLTLWMLVCSKDSKMISHVLLYRYKISGVL